MQFFFKPEHKSQPSLILVIQESTKLTHIHTFLKPKHKSPNFKNKVILDLFKKSTHKLIR